MGDYRQPDRAGGRGKKINHRPNHPTSLPTRTPQQLRWIEAAAGTQPAALASVNRVPPGAGRSPGATGGLAGRTSRCSHPAPLGCSAERAAGRRGLCVEVPREALSGWKSWELPPLPFQSKSMAHPLGDISTRVLSLVNVVIRLEYFFKR